MLGPPLIAPPPSLRFATSDLHLGSVSLHKRLASASPAAYLEAPWRHVNARGHRRPIGCQHGRLVSWVWVGYMGHRRPGGRWLKHAGNKSAVHCQRGRVGPLYSFEVPQL